MEGMSWICGGLAVQSRVHDDMSPSSSYVAIFKYERNSHRCNIFPSIFYAPVLLFCPHVQTSQCCVMVDWCALYM